MMIYSFPRSSTVLTITICNIILVNTAMVRELVALMIYSSTLFCYVDRCNILGFQAKVITTSTTFEQSLFSESEQYYYTV